MKVLLINHFPLEGSGSGTYTRNIACYLIKMGHEVCIIFPENKIPDELPGTILCPVFFNDKTHKDGIKYNFPCFTTHPRSTTTFADLNDDELAQYLSAFDSVISEKIKSFEPDIVHVQHIWCLSYLAAKHDIPLVITTHGTDLMGYEKWPRFRKYAEDAMAKCHKVIAISGYNKTAMLDLFPRADEKTILLSNGYDNDSFFPEEIDRKTLLARYDIPYDHEKIVLFAGKLTSFKGVDVLLRAEQKYEGYKPGHIITVIAGSGAEEDVLRQLEETLKLQSLHFIGHRNQVELRQLYSSADIFAMPSRNEPFGLVALEAMACGLYVIASDTGGLPDFINDKVGDLVAPDDPDALYEAIINKLYSSGEDGKEKSSIAQYTLTHYSQTNYMDKLEKIYLEIISAHKVR